MTLGSFKDEADRERYAAEQRERHRKNTVTCPHCGTPGAWTYGGLEPAWLGNSIAKLTEFSSERSHWYGVPEFSHDHTPARCIAVLKARLASAEAVVRAALKGGSIGGEPLCGSVTAHLRQYPDAAQEI
jgi:hypothetical protein